MKRNRVRLYRFYNTEQGYGEPFGLCDKCSKGYSVKPDNVHLSKLAEDSKLPCTFCGAKNKERQHA